MKKRYTAASCLISCALAFSLCACGSTAATNASTNANANAGANAGASAAFVVEGSGTSSYPQAVANMDVEYSNRDKDASYSAASATEIKLSDATSSVTIDKAGTYIVSGSLSNGQLLVDLGGADEKVQVVLNGVTIHNDNGPAIQIESADKVFITLAPGSDNKLSDGSDFVLLDGEDEPYATIYSRDDLTINGTGSLTVEANYRHAIVSKDDLVITGGTFNITSIEDALRGRDCVKIADGTFDINCGQDAVKSNNDEEETRGYVIIDGGTFNISAGDDAFHAETVLAINGGKIDVAKCYEGFEGTKVFVNGGDSSIVASDDAVNAAAAGSGSDMFGHGPGGQASAPTAPREGSVETGVFGASECLVEFNGGTLTVDTQGDGLDSNGAMLFNGGTIYVSGPTSSGNGAFDYDISAQVYGGTVIAVGATGMAQNFSGGTQAFLFANVSGNAGDKVSITDENGKELAGFTAAKQFQCVAATVQGLAEGTVVNVVVGDGGNGGSGSTTQVTASTTATSGFGGMGAGGMRGPGMLGDNNGRGGKPMGNMERPERSGNMTEPVNMVPPEGKPTNTSVPDGNVSA